MGKETKNSRYHVKQIFFMSVTIWQNNNMQYSSVSRLTGLSHLQLKTIDYLWIYNRGIEEVYPT